MLDRHHPARHITDLRMALLAFMLAPALGSAAQSTQYVSPCGNDSWTGLSIGCSAPDGPKATIQAAIDASIDGDMVLLADGTYAGPGNADLDFGGRIITLRSAGDDPGLCIIEPGFGSRGMLFHNGETADAVVQGITIRNAIASSGGGAVRILSSSPTLENCVFDGNSASSMTGGRGGGVYVQNGSPMIVNCTFRDNRCGNSKVGPLGRGGGMYLTGTGTASVINCVFIGNNATAAASQQAAGGAIYVVSGAPSVSNCVFMSNTADDTGGAVHNTGNLVMTNSIVRSNTPDQLSSTGGLTVAYCNVGGGWPGPGNIDVDPLFVDLDNENLRLLAGSPCIDAGHNWGVPPDTRDLDGDGNTAELIPLDLDGNPRFSADELDFDPGCGLPVVVDMGVYEHQVDPAEHVIFADIDGSGTVDVTDLVQLILTGACATAAV